MSKNRKSGSEEPAIHGIIRYGKFLADACEDLLYQMVRHLVQTGELSKETVFIDETRAQDLQKICRFLERQTIYDWHTDRARASLYHLI